MKIIEYMFINEAVDKLIKIKAIIIYYDWVLLIIPLANGLNFFIGCILSESTSQISLYRYTADEINEKERNANNNFITEFISKIFCKKIVGIRIIKFFK